MEKTGNKKLLIGILGAVVVLAALLALVLTQCAPAQTQTTEPTEQVQQEAESYDLYWNVDRKEYDGKSEAGMSSRKMASDGYFHVRFFKDGEMLELKVADRKLINTIDTTDLMGLTFDEDGIVTGVVTADKLPLERVGWLFYVQSTGGNLIKLNSSRRMDGLEVLLEVEDGTAIYDMTGLEGEVGRRVKMPAEMDRVIAIANLQGQVTHVFVTDRSEFMFGVEAECQHCKQVVTWKKYTKTNEFPAMSGHYILQNDIRFKGTQVQLPEDCSICVDLNGKTVSRTDGGRTIALFNPGVKFALMDSSPEQTGTIVVSGTGDQGLGVWLRYGEFHFYGGTIDARAANSRSGGAAVALDADTYMYMYGGRILGGNANAEYNEETNVYSRGIGGAVYVRGKFVMYDGIIEDGKANPVVGYNAKGQLVNNRGYGGNLYVGGSAVAELKGGIIRNGYAGVGGGNIYVDGTAELLLEGTQVQGGYVNGRGCNGGSIHVGSKASVTMSGGSVTGGYSFNEGGNIYCGGTFQMQGGYIGGGTVFDYTTGKRNEKNSSYNFFLVNGTLYHYAGTIAGGVHAIDNSATRVCTVVLSGSPVIDGGEKCKTNLTLNTYKDGIKLYVYPLSDYARVGVSSVGIFSEKTDKANADNFFSDLGAEVIHYQDRLAVGKLGCICGSDAHYGACDGEIKLWLPHTKTDSLPVTEGYWYLTDDVLLKGQQNIRGKQTLALDLNGHTVTTAEGARAYALFDPEEPITLTLTDSSEGKTGTIKAVGEGVLAEGQCVWIRSAGQVLNLYDVTLDASEAVSSRNGAALYANPGTTVNMYAGRILGGTAQAWYKEAAKAVVNGMGGNVYIAGEFNMYGGAVTGGKALSAEDGKGGYSGGAGGNLFLASKAVANLYGGSIGGGKAHSSGGNIYVSSSANLYIAGAAVTGGAAGDEAGNVLGAGGNICAAGVILVDGSAVVGGKATGNGGNIYVTGTGNGCLRASTVSGGTALRGGNLAVFGKSQVENGTQISGGTAQTGGNIFAYGAASELLVDSSTVENGAATDNGGNIYVGADGAKAMVRLTTVTGGKAQKGGNVAILQKSVLELRESQISGGAAQFGGNLYGESGTILLKAGTLKGGEAADGGNVYLTKNVCMEQQEALITAGKATNNGGNLYINSSALFRLVSGTVSDGCITRDGAGNMDVRGELQMYGGEISGGYRVDADGQRVTTSDSKRNLFAYKAEVTISGGWIEGGVMAHTADTVLNLRQDARISSGSEKPSLTLNSGATVALGKLSDSGLVVLSNDADTKIALNGEKKGLESDKGLVISHEEDGGLYLRSHTHCAGSCASYDGLHEGSCPGIDVPRKLWDGGDITVSGQYCVHEDLHLTKQAVISAENVTLVVEAVVTAEKRALVISGAEVEIIGTGAIKGKGVDGESGGVISAGAASVVKIKGVDLELIRDDAIAVINGGVMIVGADTAVTLEDLTVSGGKAVGGGNVFVNGGSVTLKKDVILIDGEATGGGNVYVYSGSFVNEAGQITGGKANNGGNLCLYNGSILLSGGVIADGEAVENGGNLFIVKGGSGAATIQGGSLQGGVAAYGGSINVQGGSVIHEAGTVSGGKASNGGNVYLAIGSYTMGVAGGANEGVTITGGTATDRNGGNVYIAGGTTFALLSGTIENGRNIDDGAGNMDVRGTFLMSGGAVRGGQRINEAGENVAGSEAKANIFAYKATVTITGGIIDGAMMAHTEATTLQVSKAARILSADAGKPSLTLNSGALITVDGSFDAEAAIVVSNDLGTKIAASGSQVYKANITSDKGLVVAVEADGMYLRNHTHCSAGCGKLNGQHTEDCSGYDVSGWTILTGGEIAADGNYCIHDALNTTDVITVTAADATLLVEGALSSEKRALHVKAGAKLTLIGSGTVEAKGANNENTGVVIVDGQLVIDGVTLQRAADSTATINNGGVITVGGQVIMNSGVIQNGQAANGGGNVFVNGGSFTFNGGEIRGGKAGVGGNVFLYAGSFTMANDGNSATEPMITGGWATAKNGGNVNTVAGTTFTLQEGRIENGRNSGGDGPGNIYLLGTLNMTGGAISGGYRVEADGTTVNSGSPSKRNVFIYKGTLNMTGGTIDGGVESYTNQSTVKLSGNAVIKSADTAKPSLSLSGGALLAVDGSFQSDAAIVVSSAVNTQIAASGLQAHKKNITSDKGLLVTVEADGMYLRTHTHCSADCGMIDGQHAAGCSGYDMIGWTVWNGGDITENGKYCIHGTKNINDLITVTAADATLLIDGTLRSEKRALKVSAGAKLTLVGNGTVEAKGANNENTGVVIVDGQLVIDGVTLQRTAGSTAVANNGGVITVGGQVIMNSGVIQNGEAANGGGNVFVNGGSFTFNGGEIRGGKAGVGGNVFLYSGSFTMANDGNSATEPVITGGWATAKNGGNVNTVAGTTFTLQEGRIENGRNSGGDGPGNIYLLGTLNMTGGTISGGYRVEADGATVNSGSQSKRNIFIYKGTLNMNGGTIDGGVESYTNQSTVKLSGNAVIKSADTAKPSLSLSGGALLAVDGSFQSGAAIVVSSAVNTQIAASGLQAYKKNITSDKGLLVTVEAGGMYLRSADTHAHCICARTDGTHAEGCNGYDVIFAATTSMPTTSGAYYLDAESVNANGLQLGSSNGSTNVSIQLCLGGKELTCESGKARIALIWGGSSLTVTDCGTGTIKANATTGNGGIFHPAANSTLTIYNGTLDSSAVSSPKPGVVIDNAGTTRIYGGHLLGGNATATNANGAGGTIKNTGTLLIAGGLIEGGRSAYRGGNIYSENGNVTITGGTIQNGKFCADTSNIDVRNGSLTITGGTIQGGNRYTSNAYTAVNTNDNVKRNIFTVNTTVTITGGTIDGGVQLFRTSGGSVKISGDPKIVSSDASLPSLSTSYQLVIAKPGMAEDAQIKITSAPAGSLAVAESGLTITAKMAECFVNASGTKATVENNEILFK